jgi:hypothetical protein
MATTPPLRQIRVDPDENELVEDSELSPLDAKLISPDNMGLAENLADEIPEMSQMESVYVSAFPSHLTSASLDDINSSPESRNWTREPVCIESEREN